jgi:O-antigen ligase
MHAEKPLPLNLSLAALYGIAFSIPFNRLAVSLSIGLLVIAWLAGGDWSARLSRLRRSSLVWVLTGFYLLHAAGMAYTSNYADGWFDLQVKLSILLLPPVILSSGFTAQQVWNVLLVFILGCLVSGLACMGNAWYIFQDTGNPDAFFYTSLSVFAHPGYYAMYICLAVLVLAVVVSENITDTGWMRHKHTLGLITLLLMLLVAMLSSKTGLIGLFVILLIVLVRLIQRHDYFKSASLLVLMLGFFAVFVNFLPSAAARFKSVEKVMSLGGDSTNTTFESTGVRVMVWKSALEIIREHYLTGTGTGDVRDSLVKKYSERQNPDAVSKKLNAHNEFLHVTIALGFAGFLLLAASLLIPFVQSIRTGDTILFSFVLLLGINFLTEAMLETQAGVVFYSFFLSLLSLLRQERINS